ncbi:ATP-binding protein [Actinomadura fibrosa]|uniref:ATP-binding protein n=1 Tax=Actinomadura fibrosa TaxID=111802 RepID=A0ABW2XD51_9ACTN|nr:ATP-binding protein [Actinomadura fibrosa]
MTIVLEMTLPRSAESAPLVRHALDASLCGLGVTSDVRADIALALGEACANVIKHAAAGREYEVRARVEGERCVVEVIDGGAGGIEPWDAGPTSGRSRSVADSAAWDGGEAPVTAESGRGLQLMRAFTDEFHVADRVSRNGAIVHFERMLAS